MNEINPPNIAEIINRKKICTGEFWSDFFLFFWLIDIIKLDEYNRISILSLIFVSRQGERGRG
ncbi:MAG: hypothetical protein QME64_02710, partial [bacterium]|nr:hypothetical protein [bacterium]